MCLCMYANEQTIYSPSNVTEAVEPSLCVLSGTRRVEATLAGLVEEWSVVIPIVWVV